MTKQKIKVNFCDHDDTFVKGENNLFLEILQKHYDVEISEKPDFLFYSCFGTKHCEYTDCVKIYYTNENVVPDFNECDYGIGFHHITFEDRYLRFTEYNLKIQPEIQNRQNLSPELAQRKFCNFVYSNCRNGEGAPLRAEFCKKLAAYKHIDCPGKVLNNMQDAISPRNGDWQAGKLEFLSNYKFTIAFENRQTNGYTTEKLFHPLMANSIPIYWGNPEAVKDFNPKAFINCNDYASFEEVIEKVKELDNDDDKYMAMLREPAMRGDYDFNGYAKLERFLTNIIEKGNKPYVRQRNKFIRYYERYAPIRDKGMHKIFYLFGIKIKVG